MKLKNVLIVVKDNERSRQFYHDLFGLELVLNRLMTRSWGQNVIRVYDPDGNLIEVGTPV